MISEILWRSLALPQVFFQQKIFAPVDPQKCRVCKSSSVSIGAKKILFEKVPLPFLEADYATGFLLILYAKVGFPLFLGHGDAHDN